MTTQPETAFRNLIDNRHAMLPDQVAQFLDSSETARFSVGYLFLAGLAPVVAKLNQLKELRLLIGNTSNRETIEQLAEGYRHLELIEGHAEAQQYPKRSVVRRMELEAADNVRSSLGVMDQTDENQEAIVTLLRMIEEGRLKVRVHTRGRLQARAYIFDFRRSLAPDGNANDRDTGVGIVGSSNLSLSGVVGDAELNVVARGNDTHAELLRWFDALWDDSRKFDERLMRELRHSWAAMQIRPYDVYMKSLFTLVRDRLHDDENAVLWDDDITHKLADFQRVAVEHAVQIIRRYGGVFVSDVVGLGKSFVGAAIVKFFERTHQCRPLIVCPASLVDMWKRYNEVYQLNARVLSMGKLREGDEQEGNFLVHDEMYQNRDFVLVDESHNFRHAGTQRYRLLEEYLSDGKRCCFLTATPRNKSAWDVYAQLKLFHQNDKTDIPVSLPSLQDYFRGVERGTHRLNELLSSILIRRTRRDILKWYGYDAETHERIAPEQFDAYRNGSKRAYVLVAGRHQFFPKRELETIEYSIDEAYQGLYEEIRCHLGNSATSQPQQSEPNQLTYARYGLLHYLLPDKLQDDRYVSLQRAGVALRGLMRVLLFKRFESSVYAFRETVARLKTSHQRFRRALEEGIVSAGEDAQDLLNDPNQSEEQELLDALRGVTGRYSATDFDLPRLIEHIDHDITILDRILDIVAPITPDRDEKLQTLLMRISQPPFHTGKCLIFSQYADTARYLYDNLVEATGRDDVEVVSSNKQSKLHAVGRFAPKANPEYRHRSNEPELNLLVATDALSEGLNLQDGDKIINYDLHWNPVRLIQRFGRIDRIGSENDTVYGFNFLPETGIEQQLGLREVLQNRIREIHETIGEDAAILDPSEQLNETAMYAIYEGAGSLPDSMGEEEEALFDLNEATEMFRLMRDEDPDEYGRITKLPDGIRTTMATNVDGVFVHCQAGHFQQLYLVDHEGNVISQDLSTVLSRIRCTPETEGVPIPKDHSSVVMRVKRLFSEDIKQREADRRHAISHSRGQAYTIRELRQIYGATDDEDKRARINILEHAFRGSIPSAVNRDLNRLRRNGVSGDNLYSALVDLYNAHGLRDRQVVDKSDTARLVPKVVCSENLAGK